MTQFHAEIVSNKFKTSKYNGTADTQDAITSVNIDRGFTMHEHIDEMGIINMNGRIYDPLIGWFMSADPYIQAPDDLQSHNRYAYVMNNPLSLDDPSGYFSISRAWKRAWKNPIFKAILGITVAIIAPSLLVQYGGAFFGSTVITATGASVTTLSLSGAISVGALSGFASTGTLKGALTGAFTAGLMHGVGTLGNHLGLESGGLGKIALHAGAGCLSSVAGGGSCKAGAMSGALGEFGNNIETGNGIELGTIKAAMLGGIGSKLSGGKFSDGAITGSFGYLFNRCMHATAGCVFEWGSNLAKIGAGTIQTAAGTAICATGLACIAGAPIAAVGASSVIEGASYFHHEGIDGFNPLKEFAQSVSVSNGGSANLGAGLYSTVEVVTGFGALAAPVSATTAVTTWGTRNTMGRTQGQITYSSTELQQAGRLAIGGEIVGGAKGVYDALRPKAQR